MLGPLLDVQTSFRVAGAWDCAPSQKWVTTWGSVAFPKNDGRRGTFEEDLQRCIFHGRHRRAVWENFNRDRATVADRPGRPGNGHPADRATGKGQPGHGQPANRATGTGNRATVNRPTGQPERATVPRSIGQPERATGPRSTGQPGNRNGQPGHGQPGNRNGLAQYKRHVHQSC